MALGFILLINSHIRASTETHMKHDMTLLIKDIAIDEHQWPKQEPILLYLFISSLSIHTVTTTYINIRIHYLTRTTLYGIFYPSTCRIEPRRAHSSLHLILSRLFSFCSRTSSASSAAIRGGTMDSCNVIYSNRHISIGSFCSYGSI